MDSIDDELLKRFADADIHPTSVLWGRGSLSSEKQLLAMETAVAEKLSAWCQGLEKQGLKQERRAARLFPEELSLTNDESSITLSFSLPSGSYATAVLREIVQL